jgi:hypothetical protein
MIRHENESRWLTPLARFVVAATDVVRCDPRHELQWGDAWSRLGVAIPGKEGNGVPDSGFGNVTAITK